MAIKITSGEQRSGGTGVGFSGLLTVAFITLKLAKVIQWSWWWVLSPIWITVLIALILLGIIVAISK